MPSVRPSVTPLGNPGTNFFLFFILLNISPALIRICMYQYITGAFAGQIENSATRTRRRRIIIIIIIIIVTTIYEVDLISDLAILYPFSRIDCTAATL